jgi:hypothetical protein
MNMNWHSQLPARGLPGSLLRGVSSNKIQKWTRLNGEVASVRQKARKDKNISSGCSCVRQVKSPAMDAAIGTVPERRQSTRPAGSRQQSPHHAFVTLPTPSVTPGGSGPIGAAREVAGMTAKVNAATAIARITRIIVILPAFKHRPACLLNAAAIALPALGATSR